MLPDRHSRHRQVHVLSRHVQITEITGKRENRVRTETTGISARDATIVITAFQEMHAAMTEDRETGTARIETARIVRREIMTVRIVRSETMMVRIVPSDRERTMETADRDHRDVRRALRNVQKEEMTVEDSAAARTVRARTAAVSVRTPERMIMKQYLLRS